MDTGAHAAMSGLKVCVRAVSGERCCAWALPPCATALDVQALVKAELGIKVQHQRLAVGSSVIEGLVPLSLYTAEELGNVTLVVTSARTCEGCGREGRARACAGCRRAYYCSQACQRRAWRAHRSRCRSAWTL